MDRTGEHAVKPTACAALAVALLVLTTACTAEEAPPPGDVAHYAPEGPGGDAAQLIGQLERLDGCVYVVVPGPDGRTVPVFPDDPAIRWDGETLLAASLALPLGEQVELGGGEGSAGSDSISVPEACDPDAPLFIVNS
ncbi:hypothetical protein ACFWEJ_05895 [Promicromonospora sp. NPDC060204]|uniref:hypothetical protein n=1 Tax=Promicromonospora sp. NPDC060204 TaxID=3347071 RepID=UPI003646376F